MSVPAAPDVIDEPPVPPVPPDPPVPPRPATPVPPFPPVPGLPGDVSTFDVHATAKRQAATRAARVQAGRRPSSARIDPKHIARDVGIAT